MNNLIYKNMSIGLELAIYFSFGLATALLNIFPTYGIVAGVLGSISIELIIKLLSAMSGSASGAKLFKTISTSDFWTKIGIGFACSAALSSTVHDLLFPRWNIYSIYYLTGVFGVLVLRIGVKFLRRVENRSDEIADSVLETGNKLIKLKEKKQKDNQSDL